jgi:hypothetical protein
VNPRSANPGFGARNSESALRNVCRAVIRRVCDEHPESAGCELFLRLWAAYPFGAVEGPVQQVWFEEVLDAVGGVERISGSSPGNVVGLLHSKWIQ